jgi:hypothetical protein
MAPGLVGQTIERARGMPTMQPPRPQRAKVWPQSLWINASSLQRRSTQYHEANTHSAQGAGVTHCSFCGGTDGPFTKVEGLFTVMMCADCQAARGHGSGPYPVMTRAEMRAGLDLMPTWALAQKAAAFSVLGGFRVR